MNLAISRCSKHGYWMVSVERPGSSGTRITPSKCCGSWETVKTWPLSAEQWNEIANLAQQAEDS